MMVMSTFGRFHFPQAADALAATGTEVILHAADVLARTRRAKLVRGDALTSIGNAGLRKVNPPWLERALVRRFDERVARWLDRHAGPDAVFHGGSLYCLESLAAARRLGLHSAVERSGAHVRVQRRLMAEEHQRLGLIERRTGYALLPEYDARMMEEYELAERIVVSSTASRDTFVCEGIAPAKLAVVPLGANYPVRAWAPRATRPFRVLSVGGDFARKGMADLLEAWRLAALADALLELRCPIPAGRPAELAAQNRVTVLPPMPHASLAHHFERASVFCLLSIEDGFGMVVSEAMAFGCPVIVSRNVGAKDIVQDGVNGFVVDIRNPEDVAERLTRLYRDPELLQAMSRQAIASAHDFSWARYAHELSALWNRAACNVGAR